MNFPRTKKEVLSMLFTLQQKATAEMMTAPQHSLSYYRSKSFLIQNFSAELDRRNLFIAPDGWYYSFEITNRVARLLIKHQSPLPSVEEGCWAADFETAFDERFCLMNYPVETLTVEEFSSKNNIKPVTVRQWIRRGKLRNVTKIGGEWRIPAITDLPSRGYTPVTYYTNGEYVQALSAIGFHGFRAIQIDIIPHEKSMFEINVDGYCADHYQPRLFTDQERGQLELSLISNPRITSSAAIVGTWPDEKAMSLIHPVFRSGGRRLPDWFDIGLL